MWRIIRPFGIDVRMISCVLTLLLQLNIVAQAQVLPPNSNPSFTAGASNITVLEDSGLYSATWATNISDGEGVNGANSGKQSLSFLLTGYNAALFAVEPKMSSTGVLTFTSASNAFGTTTITVTLKDDGTPQCVSGGNNKNGCPASCSPRNCALSSSHSLTIIITAVNDCPRFQVAGNPTVQENSGIFVQLAFATQVSAGSSAEDRIPQSITWQLTTSSPELFSSLPSMPSCSSVASCGATSRLTFTPAKHRYGTATVSIVAFDDGGTANGGCHQSTTISFQIIVKPMNDAPRFIIAGANPYIVLEDNGTVSVDSYITNVSAGGKIVNGSWSTETESFQALTFSLTFVEPKHSALFSTAPTITPATGSAGLHRTLTFTAKADANTFGKKVLLYLQLKDDGGNMNGNVDKSCDPITACPTIEIQITPVNDAASFVSNGNVEVWEDLFNMGIAPVPPVFSKGTAWASQISVGPDNEGSSGEGQMAVFEVTNTDNKALFDRQPAIDSLGTLTFQLKKDAFGTANLIAVITDTGEGDKVYGTNVSFQIRVLPVNDPPNFQIFGANPLIIQEDSGVNMTMVSLFASNLNVGPQNEADAPENQTASFLVIPQDKSFFSIQPSVDITSSSTASLSFQLTPNKWGKTTLQVIYKDTGKVERRGKDLRSLPYFIEVTPVNDAPTFSLYSTTVAVIEDSAKYTQAGFAFNVSAGASDNSGSGQRQQQVRFLLTSSTGSSFFQQLPSIDLSGQLTFQVAPNQFGNATITVIAQDDLDAKSIAQTFGIIVLKKNDAPTFSLGSDLVGRAVTECLTVGSCTRSFPNFLKDLRVGPDNEISEEGQKITSLNVSFPSNYQYLFDVNPQIDQNSGLLTFTLKQYAETETTSGSQSVPLSVTAKDDGGTLNGGSDTTTKIFYLSVANVENPPNFTVSGSTTITVLEDAGAQTISSWATNIQKSPTSTNKDITNLQFVISSLSDATLFQQIPVIYFDAGKTTASLYFTSKVNRFGSATFQVVLDNTENNENSDSTSVTITITPVNDAPALQLSSSDLTFLESSSAETASVIRKSGWATGITAGPFEDGGVQTLNTSISCDKPLFFEMAPILELPSGDLLLKLASSSSSSSSLFGDTLCTLKLQDSGGVLNNGVDLFQKVFTLHVTAKNDAPSFLLGTDITVLESSGAHVYANWSNQVSSGHSDGTQQLTFVMERLDDDCVKVFAVAPKVSVVVENDGKIYGSLSFTLKEHQNGVCLISIYLKDDGKAQYPNEAKSALKQFRIIITPVNSKPSFYAGSNIAVLEQTSSSVSLHRYFGWATSIMPAPISGVELSQSLKFNITVVEKKNLFSLNPAISVETGDLVFQLAQGQSGLTSVLACLQDNGGTSNGGIDKNCQTFSISVVEVNTAPSAVHPSLITITEDAGPITLANFLTGLSPSEGTQKISKVQCLVTKTNQVYFKTLPEISMISSSYNLTFEMGKDYFGELEVMVKIVDNGGSANGGSDTQESTFKIRVLAVNDPPTCQLGPLLIEVLEDSVQPYLMLWATQIEPGPRNEAAQTTLFHLTAANPGLFEVQPAISSQGYLSFQVKSNQHGSTAVVITHKDNGGVELGGNDTVTYGVQQASALVLNISILSVNDPPSFQPGGTFTISEDTGPYVARSWATKISAGVQEPILSSTNLTFRVKLHNGGPNDFFSVAPAISTSTGDLSFTVGVHRYGTVILSVVLCDQDGTANGGKSCSDASMVSLSVTPVNDKPFFTVSRSTVTVLEDAGAIVIANFIASSSPGPFEASTQSVLLSVSYVVQEPKVLSTQTFFTSEPKIFGGALHFTTAPDVNGKVDLVVNISDRIGGVWQKVVPLTVTPVNDPPTAILDPNNAVVTIQEGNLLSTHEYWLSSVVAGPTSDETDVQLLTPHVSIDRRDILAALPLIDVKYIEGSVVGRKNHSLTIQLRPFAYGTVNCRVYFTDDGGTLNGGSDTSSTFTFQIVVTPVNQNPTFVPGPPILSIVIPATLSSSPLATYSYAAPWASDISAGPFLESKEQTLAFDVRDVSGLSQSTMFTSKGQPQISAATGVLSFVLKAMVTGNITLEVKLRDSAGAVSYPSSFLMLMITSKYSTDLVVMVVNAEYQSFSVLNFQSVVASSLTNAVQTQYPNANPNAATIRPNDVVIRSVTAGSVVLKFQVIPSAALYQVTKLTSEDLAKILLLLATTSSGSSPSTTNIEGNSTVVVLSLTLATQLGLLSVYVTSVSSDAQYLPTGPYTFTPAPAANSDFSSTSSSSSSASGTNYVALAIGLFAAIAVIVLVIYLIYSWRKKHEEKKFLRRKQHYPAGYPQGHPTSSRSPSWTRQLYHSPSYSPRSPSSSNEGYGYSPPIVATPVHRNPIKDAKLNGSGSSYAYYNQPVDEDGFTAVEVDEEDDTKFSPVRASYY